MVLFNAKNGPEAAGVQPLDTHIGVDFRWFSSMRKTVQKRPASSPWTPILVWISDGSLQCEKQSRSGRRPALGHPYWCGFPMVLFNAKNSPEAAGVQPLDTHIGVDFRWFSSMR